ncbi:uncharacterized protein [Diadema setosum]|uniref:uncharacterized protein n=1 Tax=Diadema setosum TaxID=31175 RepID=UPI003B3AD40A
MDQQKSARPQRLAATKAKNYGPSVRKPATQVRANSPSSPNPKVTNPAPMTPAASQRESLEGQTASDAESVELVPDDVTNMAVASTTVTNPTHPDRGTTMPADKEALASAPPNVQTPGSLDAYFKEATSGFNKMIQDAVDKFLGKLSDLEANIEASIQFESKRVDDLEVKQKEMEGRMKRMEKEIAELRSEVLKNKAETNKTERISRRNNIRIVGIPETPNDQREDCAHIVEDILRSKFKMTTKVERAHRDGRKVEGRPRHILIKFLSYREKVDVIRRAREILKDERYFMIDDLTQTDLEEKQKWKKQVQEMYSKGTKLRFYAGKWRQTGGAPFNFE